MTSENRTVTTLRVSRTAACSSSGWVQFWQNFARSEFSSPQFGQILTRRIESRATTRAHGRMYPAY